MSSKKQTNYSSGKIYKIVNTANDMIYIGSTVQLLSRRMKCHRAFSAKRSSIFYEAMKVIGSPNFKIVLIEAYPCASKAALEAREYKLMSQISASLLYNSIIDRQHSLETKRKMSEERVGTGNSHFKRGCIHDRASRWSISFEWKENKVSCSQSFGYKTKRTREAAYMECLNLRNAIYPLTFAEYASELPFNCHE